MSSVKIYNKSQQVYPDINKAGKDTLGGVMSVSEGTVDTTFMSPVVVTNEGYLYNGLNIIETEEDGFFVVDKNMNAIFSSRNVVSSNSSSGTPSSPSYDSTLSTRVSLLESDLSDIKVTLGALLGNYKIEME